MATLFQVKEVVMASKIDICNRALSYLGANLISSIDENNKSAQFCRLFYTDVLEETLRSHPWNFATKRVALNQVEYETTNGAVAYQLPSDCLRPLRNATSTQITYDIENEYLLTSESTFTLIYIALIEDVNKYDTMFRKELAQALALELCSSLTNSSTLKQELKAEFNEQRALAQNVDSQDDNEINYISSGEMLDVRRGYGNGLNTNITNY